MSNKSYDGDPIDMAWSTPPWQNDGETLEAYDSDGDGKVMTNNWPENATDPDELNERQKKMILTAARYPTVDSPTQLVELSGLDVAPSYPQNVLEPHWPERFWGANNSDKHENLNEMTDQVDEVRKRLLEGDSLNQLIKEYPVSQDYLSRLVRGEIDGLTGCEIPPLSFHTGKQRWINPDQFYDESVETNYDNDNKASLTEPISELRRRALAGETAHEIANDHGVSDRTIRKRLKGDYSEDDPNVGPLEYDKDSQRWRLVGADEDGTQQQTLDREETPNMANSHTSNNQTNKRPIKTAFAALVALVFAWVAKRLS